MSSDRRSFIIRRGVLRYGVILGLLVFAWIVDGDYATVLERLRTPAGWWRLLLLFLLCLGEWTIGAGWLIGNLLWFLRRRPLPPLRLPRRG